MAFLQVNMGAYEDFGSRLVRAAMTLSDLIEKAEREAEVGENDNVARLIDKRAAVQDCITKWSYLATHARAMPHQKVDIMTRQVRQALTKGKTFGACQGYSLVLDYLAALTPKSEPVNV